MTVRKVHRNIPWFEYQTVRYSVPPDLVGQTVEIRRPVGADTIMVRWAGTIVAVHQIASDGVHEVWDRQHRRAAERAALVRRRRHLTVVPDKVSGDAEPVATPQPQLGPRRRLHHRGAHGLTP